MDDSGDEEEVADVPGTSRGKSPLKYSASELAE
jgi:hypothetical protein